MATPRAVRTSVLPTAMGLMPPLSLGTATALAALRRLRACGSIVLVWKRLRAAVRESARVSGSSKSTLKCRNVVPSGPPALPVSRLLM